MKIAELGRKLELVYNQYHSPNYILMDPIQCVYRFKDKKDRELAGLIASSLAYGRAEIIIRNCNDILDRAGSALSDFVVNTTFKEKQNLLKGFKHRFNDALDITILFQCLCFVLNEYGSLENLFLETGKVSLKDALNHFTDYFKRRGLELAGYRKKSFEYLFPSPQSGSACKRMNMFLRWMVRPADSIDFGLWSRVAPSSLIIPVDTHIASIARRLGMTDRKNADWVMAEQITAVLRQIDPDDPVRFDFSMCRVGMVDFRRDAA